MLQELFEKWEKICEASNILHQELMQVLEDPTSDPKLYRRIREAKRAFDAEYDSTWKALQNAIDAEQERYDKQWGTGEEEEEARNLLREYENASWEGKREIAKMQALAGWHHVQEAPAARNTVQRCQAPSLKGAAACMSMN